MTASLRSNHVTMNLLLLERLARHFEHCASDADAEQFLEPLIQISAKFQPFERGIESHLHRVSAYVGILARALSVPNDRVIRLQCASVLHDVGMVLVPSETLNKPGALTEAEIHVIQKHAEAGYSMLSNRGLPLLEVASRIAWAHHERFDGSGYPLQLRGDDIPLAARMVSVADVFDALTTSSTHKMAYPVEAALDMMREGSGSLFDPALITVLQNQRDALLDIAEEAGQPPFGASLEAAGSFQISQRDQRVSGTMPALSKRYYSCPFCRKIHPRELWRCPETNHEIREHHRLSGCIINQKYHLHKAIGAGGMAAVYEARNLLTERRVAIKLLDLDQCDAATNTRFLDEARIYAAVGHPNLVEVIDVDSTESGNPYMVMEFLEGHDLEEVLSVKKAFTEKQACKVTLEILKPLAAVHKAGIVHRDLKPSNIFFTHKPKRVKLLDFGIALWQRADGSHRRLTDRNSFIGTPQYMSPEQAFNKATIDHRSDLFTVGELLYEMITGRTAFTASTTMGIMMAVANGNYPPPRTLCPELSSGMEHVLTKALQLDIDARYQSAADFSAALAAMLETHNVSTSAETAA